MADHRSARRRLGFDFDVMANGRTQYALARRAGRRRLGWSADGPAERSRGAGFSGTFYLGRNGWLGNFDVGRGFCFYSGRRWGRGFDLRGGCRLYGFWRGRFFHHDGPFEKMLLDLVDQVALDRA